MMRALTLFLVLCFLVLPVSAAGVINPSTENQPFWCQFYYTKWICAGGSTGAGGIGPQGIPGINGTGGTGDTIISILQDRTSPQYQTLRIFSHTPK